ncbi:MAG: rhodanese-like domain-containing protein [Ginsengibacter sp.]
MKNISPEEVKQRLDAGEALHLIDVRESYENVEFNIGGKLIPLGRIQSLDIDELEALKDEEVIFYCRSGNRSGIAAMIMDQSGFTNTKNLTGGMLAWQEKFVN